MSEIHLPHDHGGDAPLAAIQEKLQKTDAFQKTAALFQQLGDPTRLRIFWLLCHLPGLRDEYRGPAADVQSRRLPPSAAPEGQRPDRQPTRRPGGLL